MTKRYSALKTSSRKAFYNRKKTIPRKTKKTMTRKAFYDRNYNTRLHKKDDDKESRKDNNDEFKRASQLQGHLAINIVIY